MSDKHYVYILLCKDNTLYTGYAIDLRERIEKHTLGKGAKYTRGRGPFELVYQEVFLTKEAAMQREWQIKQLPKEKKISLIEGCDKLMETGVLYICATPIGNLEDITLRVLRILKEVDLIAAEDTRHTRKLLSFYDIHQPMTSYHEHNKKEKGLKLIEKLINGQNIALVTDAGTPGISDPGCDLIQLAIENKIKVVALPGPSALINALVISGLPTDEFIFIGFLPMDKKLRRHKIEQLEQEIRTIILYEAPHRLKTTLKELADKYPDREAVVVRELTKKFEEVRRGNINELLLYYQQIAPKGEICLLIKGITEADVPPKEFELSLNEHVEQYINKGLNKKEAIKEVAKIRGLPKRDVYNQILKVNNNEV